MGAKLAKSMEIAVVLQVSGGPAAGATWKLEGTVNESSGDQGHAQCQKIANNLPADSKIAMTGRTDDSSDSKTES